MNGGKWDRTRRELSGMVAEKRLRRFGFGATGGKCVRVLFLGDITYIFFVLIID